MAISSPAPITVGDEPVLIASGVGSGTVLINTDQDLKVGGTSDDGAQNFTILANAADPGYHSLSVQNSEELWAVLAGATDDAEVEVFQSGL